MHDDVTPAATIHCSILRQAGYKPGTWLFSDIHDNVYLFIDNADKMAGLLEEHGLMEDNFWANVPFLVTYP